MTASSGSAACKRAREWTSYDVGMCLQWARWRAWDVPSVYGSAIDAWNGARHKHAGDRTPPTGAPCFYRGGNYGHVVVFMEAGTDMRGTDMPSTGRVSEAAISWVEQHWGYTYLGWTEDLNGVMLPLGQEEDVKEEDVQAIASRVVRMMGDYDKTGKADPSNPDPDTGSQRLRQIENVVRDIKKKTDKL